MQSIPMYFHLLGRWRSWGAFCTSVRLDLCRVGVILILAIFRFTLNNINKIKQSIHLWMQLQIQLHKLFALSEIIYIIIQCSSLLFPQIKINLNWVKWRCCHVYHKTRQFFLFSACFMLISSLVNFCLFTWWAVAKDLLV